MSTEQADLLQQILVRLSSIEARLEPIEQHTRTAAHEALGWQTGLPPSNSHVVMEQVPGSSHRPARWRYL